MHHNQNYENEINLQELFSQLWKKKLSISIITTSFIIASLVYSFLLPDIYKSETTIMPVDNDSSVNSILGQYAGVANLAGVNFPSEQSSKSKEAIARIQSFDFFSNNFLTEIKFENLMAVNKWNKKTNTFTYNKKLFNPDTKKWNTEASSFESSKPSIQEAYIKYEEIINITEDKTTSFITLSVKHESPVLAQKWLNIILNQIDKVMREEDKREAYKAIEYLNGLTSTINYEEIKRSLSLLQQEQMKRLMMVEASENYIFKTLDSPLVPEIRFTPKRSLIIVLGTILGIIFSVIVSIIPDRFKKTI